MVGSGSMAAAEFTNPTNFEQGWAVMQQGIDKLINLIEGASDQRFTSEEYMHYYTTLYDLCKPQGPNPMPDSHCMQFYDGYKKTFEDYIISKVLPALRGKKDEGLLQQVVKRWSNHKIMTRWLSRFFYFLDRYFLVFRKLPSLEEASFLTFYCLVYGEFNDQVRGAVISMIDRGREGEQIDEDLIKVVLAIYVDIGRGAKKDTVQDFEEALLKGTALFYSRKAANWITSEPYEDYMLKANICLKHEKGRVSNFLQTESQNKLLEVVQHELLSVHASELKEKKQLDVNPLAEGCLKNKD